MTSFEVAARNLLRNRRRSLATMLTTAIGVLALLLFGGYRTDLIHYILTMYARASGHVLVQQADFMDYGGGNPALYSVKNAYAVRDALLADPELGPRIFVATPLLNFPAVAGNSAHETSKTVFLSGIVPADQTRMRRWNYYSVKLPSEPHPLDGKSANGVLLGEGVARMLQICSVLPRNVHCGAQTTVVSQEAAAQADTEHADLQDLVDLERDERAADAPARGDPERTIEVLAATTRGVPNVRSFEVVSAENQALKELDDAFVGADYEAARALLFGEGASEATTISVVLHDPGDVAAVMKRANRLLAERFPDQRLVARNVREVAPIINQTVNMFNVLFGFVAVLMLAIVMFTVANTVRTAIMERTVEIGTIRALGLRRSMVMRLFLIEAGLLAFAGAVVGTIAAVFASWFINAIGLTWTPPNSSASIPLTVAVANQYRTMLLIIVAASVFSTLAAVPAASKAARLNIVDALRHA